MNHSRQLHSAYIAIGKPTHHDECCSFVDDDPEHVVLAMWVMAANPKLKTKSTGIDLTISCFVLIIYSTSLA
jgi:hypothetical protein